MSKESHNAIRSLYRAVYGLDKDWGFAMPQRKAELADYCHQLRKAVDKAFEIAEINPIKGHKFDYHPEKAKGSGNSKRETEGE